MMNTQPSDLLPPLVFLSAMTAPEEPFRDRLETLLAGNFRIFSIKNDAWTELESAEPPAEIRRRIRAEYQKECIVIVVLIGAETWRSKRVDWEISAALRVLSDEPHKGLLGLLLPTHPDFGKPSYDMSRIPPRLYENIVAGYAALGDWCEDVVELRDLILEAESRAAGELPVNTFPHFTANCAGMRWRRMEPTGN